VLAGNYQVSAYRLSPKDEMVLLAPTEDVIPLCAADLAGVTGTTGPTQHRSVTTDEVSFSTIWRVDLVLGGAAREQ
jgi:hypothetical protein